MLSPEDYAILGGTECPVCGETWVDGGAPTYGNDTITEVMVCKGCKSSWVEVYKLTGYEDLQLGDIEDE